VYHALERLLIEPVFRADGGSGRRWFGGRLRLEQLHSDADCQAIAESNRQTLQEGVTVVLHIT
jgi:hypothetical protein